MITYARMLALLSLYAMVVLLGVKYQPDKDSFFDTHDTLMLRGLFCIIVVLVHVPASYQNRIQDMIGSFAYIGVTFFFMTSAYGLKWSTLHKKNYLHHFWRKRLPAILLPQLLANVISACINVASGEQVSFLTFIYVDSWVRILLLFYLVFWTVYRIEMHCKLTAWGGTQTQLYAYSYFSTAWSEGLLVRGYRFGFMRAWGSPTAFYLRNIMT